MMNKTYVFGDVVRVAFPFADSVGLKERPAVVVSSHNYHLHRPDILVVALSSRLAPVEILGEFVLTAWQEAGLEKPTRLKSVVATVKKDRIISSLGHLNAQDQKKLEVVLANIFRRAPA